MIGLRGRWSWRWNFSHSHLGGVLVWDSPRREGVLPAGDIRGDWNVTLVPAVWRVGGTRHVPRAEKGTEHVPRAEDTRVCFITAGPITKLFVGG